VEEARQGWNYNVECRCVFISWVGKVINDVCEFEPATGPAVDKHDRDRIGSVGSLVDEVKLSAPVDRSGEVGEAVKTLLEAGEVVVCPFFDQGFHKGKVGFVGEFLGSTFVSRKVGSVGETSFAKTVAKVRDLVVGIDDRKGLGRRDGRDF